jgi:hypothetical protein
MFSEISGVMLRVSVEQSCTDNYKPFDQVMHFAGYGDYVSHLQRNQIFTDVTVSIGTEIYATLNATGFTPVSLNTTCCLFL